MHLLRVAICSALLQFLAGPGLSQTGTARVVGYYTSWSIYGRDYHVPDIPADSVSHINYAFAKIEDGRIALGDPYADIDRWYPGDSWAPDSLRGCFHQLEILKRAHPHLKTLISVGGWTWSAHFSDVALTPQSRALFAASCVEFVQEYGFDGVDIDWEYPVHGGMPGNTQRPEDKQNCTLLLAELRSQLDAAGDYLLTIAGPAGPDLIDNFEVDAIHPYLDWINVMAYDFHGPWGGDGDPVTHFNAALFPASDDPLGEPFRSQFNLSAAALAYLDLGTPPEKLHAGLAFYGRGFGGVYGGVNGLYSPYSGASSQGTWEPGVFDYWDLAAHYIDSGGYTSHRHPEARVPWLYSPQAGVFVSYDDGQSIAEKCVWSLQQGLGGVMFWEFSADREAELLGSALEALQGTASADGGDGSIPDPMGPGRGMVHGPSASGLIASAAWDPNPAQPQSTCRFRLDSPASIRLSVFDLQGRTVWSESRTDLAAGWHRLYWHGRDTRGRELPAGLYFWKLECGKSALQGRLVRVF